MEKLDYLSLRHIARFLSPKDIVRFGRTCKHVYSAMPQVVLANEEWLGEAFHISGPSGGHWSPELYFDAPELPSTVKRLSLTVTWRDQGWGNRKGELFLKLMRPAVNGNPVEIAEHRGTFGIAEHYEKTSEVVIERHPIVSRATPGDFYRFMRNAGGGGGHRLLVKYFRAVASVHRVKY